MQVTVVKSILAEGRKNISGVLLTEGPKLVVGSSGFGEAMEHALGSGI